MAAAAGPQPASTRRQGLAHEGDHGPAPPRVVGVVAGVGDDEDAAARRAGARAVSMARSNCDEYTASMTLLDSRAAKAAAWATPSSPRGGSSLSGVPGTTSADRACRMRRISVAKSSRASTFGGGMGVV